MTYVPDTATVTGHSVRVGSPKALLALVPTLLGFVPEDSFVVIGVEQPRGAVKVTLRYDLPDPADPELAADIADHAVAVLTGQGLTGIIAVGYGPETLIAPLAATLLAAAAQAELTVGEVLRAGDGRYWSYTCLDQTCCPEKGVRYDTAPGQLLGILLNDSGPVLGDRAALAATIAPVTGPDAESMADATRRAERHLLQLLAERGKPGGRRTVRMCFADQGTEAVQLLISQYRAGATYTEDDQVAWLTVLLKELQVRDDAWARMDPDHRGAHLRLWTDVVRLARPGYVAAPASLLAFTAWQNGNGALANVALDRALADNPHYSMAHLLRQVLAAGAPPSMARLPMTPAEVAAAYDEMDPTDADGPAGQDEKTDGDDPAASRQPAATTA
jgi:hypothetical protein